MLQQLKTLALYEVSDDFVDVFNSLPAGGLNEIRLFHVNLNTLTTLFKRQTNIKKLSFVPIGPRPTIPNDIFDNLTLESFEMKNCNIPNTEKLLSKQTKLKSLSLHLVRVDDKFVDAVANRFTDLETFYFYVATMSSISAASVAKINSLKGLKKLSFGFDGNSTEHLRSIANVPNPSMKVLHLGSIDFDSNFIEALAKSVPNLNILSINKRTTPTVAAAILKYFNFVENLDISPDVWNKALAEVNSFNPNLTELAIDIGELSDSMVYPCVKKLIADYPNLTVLQLRMSGTILSALFRRIVDGFTKLQVLVLMLDNVKLTVSDRKYLQRRSKEVTIYLEDELREITEEKKKRLSTVCGEKLWKLKVNVGANRDYYQFY